MESCIMFASWADSWGASWGNSWGHIFYGGGSYSSSHYERIKQYREEKRLAKLKLKQNEKEQALRLKELADIELQREDDLADRELQRRFLLAAKELENLKKQHNNLLLKIEFFKRDEDEITILLLSCVI